ncbi:3-oxoacyl-ACP reductase family protein [uncultured Propionibacterium sp.]|uniref:SDR family NAD(P)-dependent oxidoreductase n=1 Tax=uncultured Propionibacterium sp. TaxID=218066 RepID=UPI002930B86D|nr:3-oxoacyl-ACP reductase family protein [uncultured Propionibacterium sp.]
MAGHESSKDGVAIVTGGSRGIGAAVSERLSGLGMDVNIMYERNAKAARQVAEQMTSKGRKATTYQVDVSDENEVNEVVEEIVGTSGKIDLLVNNAAIIDDRLIMATSLAGWGRVLEVNITGTFLMTRAVLPYMLDRGHGKIINISSNSARIPGPGQAAYAASKGAVEAFTRVVAMEVGRKGIRANAVAPGRIMTDMTRDLVDKLGAGTDDSRWGTPEDVAAVVSFLASPEADYVQGQVITVDGGRLVMRPRSQ